MGRRPPRPALLAISHGTAVARRPGGRRGTGGCRRTAAPRRGLGRLRARGRAAARCRGILDAIPQGNAPVVIDPAAAVCRLPTCKRRSHRPDRRAGEGVVIAPALGPTPGSVDTSLARLAPLAPGLRRRPLLAVAGSSDDRANEDCRVTARMLGERHRARGVGGLPRRRRPAPRCRGGGGRCDSRCARRGGRLPPRPGLLPRLAVRMAAGAPVAPPLLGDDEPPASIIDIVVDRYRAAAGLSD